jgi:hypothetical protein
MENCIVGVLPALVDEPARGAACIAEITAAVAAGPHLDPLHRSERVRPECPCECQIAGPPGILGEQQQKQWSSIDAAVILSERYFSGRRHLAVAQLVEDLTRLLVTLRVMALALHGR